MGQGCSTDTGLGGTADPVVREIVDASLSAIDDLRRRAHQERFGVCDVDTQTDTVKDTVKDAVKDAVKDTKRACTVGQERLLFPNLSALEKKALASPLLETSGSGGPSPRPRGRGNHRKIAESFEAERKTKTIAIAVGGEPSSQESSTNRIIDGTICVNVEAAVLEDFEEALTKQIGSVCPTRLWIRRRPLSKNRRKLKLKLKTKAKQEKQQKQESRDTGMVLLEQGSCYLKDENYFGGRGDSDCHRPQTATTEDSIPNPYRSTHIYAIRYSDECDKDSSGSSDDERSASSFASSASRGRPLAAGDRSPKKRTESPPLPATMTTRTTTGTTTTNPLVFGPPDATKLRPIITPTPTIDATTIVTVDDASCPSQDDDACSSVDGIFGRVNMALPPKRDGTYLNCTHTRWGGGGLVFCLDWIGWVLSSM
jgi:hypothetical protein